MAVCKDSEILKELTAVKQRKLRKVYYVYGPEQYVAHEIADALKAALGDGYARELFHADEWDVGEFLAAAGSFSLFDSAKFLVVKNADSINAKEWEALQPLLKEPPESATLLFLAEGLDNRKKHAQALAKAGAEVAVVKCEPVDESAFFARARKLAEARKKKLTTPATQLLWDRVGPSLFELEQSIEKAAIYGLDNPSIEAEHVEATVVKTRQEVVFAFSDAVNAGDRKAALECLSQLHAQGEEPIAIVALLARQYRWMLEIAVRVEARESADQITRALGLFPKLAKALHSGARRLGKEGVLKGINTLKSADHALKSTMEPGLLVLERMTLDLFAK